MRRVVRLSYVGGMTIRAALTALALLTALPGQAQTPFPLYDPFYFHETARFGYDDAYAVSGEIAFRPDPTSSTGAFAPEALTVAGRIDLRLGPNLDVSAVVDASSESVGRTLQWSWAAARYAWTTDAGTVQAFRLALDPSADGSVGFPLVDAGFFSSGAAIQRLGTDVGVGVRRVQRGYQRFVPVITTDDGTDFDVRFERAFGWEVRATGGASYILDASGSRLYASLVGMRGAYDLQTLADSTTGTEAATRTLRSGAVWLQAGLAFDRPGLRLAPYVRFPLYTTPDPDAVEPTAVFGFQLMLR
ncbi:MAG: hypothetical protein IAE99_10180 [Rhodothermales bacterium]|nr:hypothetical protein [Rhodothermales bacterium]